jgi:hypothetical protein
MAGRNIVNTITRDVFFKGTHYSAGNGLIPRPKPGYLYLVTAEMKQLAGDRADLIVVRVL